MARVGAAQAPVCMTTLRCHSLLMWQWARRTGSIFSMDIRLCRSLLMSATVGSIRFDIRLLIVSIDRTKRADDMR
jgi:hypothetical protein